MYKNQHCSLFRKTVQNVNIVQCLEKCTKINIVKCLAKCTKLNMIPCLKICTKINIVHCLDKDVQNQHCSLFRKMYKNEYC